MSTRREIARLLLTPDLTIHLPLTRRTTPPDASNGPIPAPRTPSTPTPAMIGADHEQVADKLAGYVRRVAHTAPPPTPALLPAFASAALLAAANVASHYLLG